MYCARMYWHSPAATVTHERDLKTLQLVDEGELVRVDREHMVSSSGHTTTLSNSEKISTHAVVFCTGWQRSNLSLFSSSLAYGLGQPVDFASVSASARQYWDYLDKIAEDHLLETYPTL